MKKNNWIIGIIILILIVAGLGLWFWTKNKNTSNTNQNQNNTNANTNTNTNASNISYFSDTATVMYFYSDSCHWCQQEKTILEKLGSEGYKVKPMNVGTDQSLWEKYNIQGTPTFVAANSERATGYQEYDALKKFLDNHK